MVGLAEKPCQDLVAVDVRGVNDSLTTVMFRMALMTVMSVVSVMTDIMCCLYMALVTEWSVVYMMVQMTVISMLSLMALVFLDD
jgi:hypothetical protein